MYIITAWVLWYTCPYHDLFRLQSQAHCLTPVASFLWDPPHQLCPPSPCPVTRQGVRGLIICTDPGLAPRGGCPSTDALDPIDTGRGRRRGGGKQTLAPASRPSSAGWWMSRTSRSLPPKPVESSYNELQSLSKKTVLPGTLPPSSSQAAHEPHSSPRTQASPPQTLEVYPWQLSPPPTWPFQLSALTVPILTSSPHLQVQPQAGTHQLPFHYTAELLMSGCCRAVFNLTPDCLKTFHDRVFPATRTTSNWSTWRWQTKKCTE